MRELIRRFLAWLGKEGLSVVVFWVLGKIAKAVAATGILGKEAAALLASPNALMAFIFLGLLAGLVWVLLPFEARLWRRVTANVTSREAAILIVAASLGLCLIIAVCYIIWGRPNPIASVALVGTKPTVLPKPGHPRTASPPPKPTPTPQRIYVPQKIYVTTTSGPTPPIRAVAIRPHKGAARAGSLRTSEPLAAQTPQSSPPQNNGAASNNQSGGITFQGQNNGTISQSTQAERKQLIEGLQNFYTQGIDIQSSLINANTDQDVDRATNEIDGWYNAASGWIIQNMGPAAQRKFANMSDWLSRFYMTSGGNHITKEGSKRNDYLNRVGSDLENLQYLMQNPQFDRQ